MKKILLSVGILVGVGALVWGATAAFYNDTETSNGNIFVAGSIDLKVDHLKQTYNGVDCKTCSVVVMSDTSNLVVDRSVGAGDQTNHPAVLVTSQPASWTADNDPDLAGASWIWATDPTLTTDKNGNEWYKFQKKFTWMGPISGANIIFNVGADNSYEIRLNGNLIGSDPGEFNYTNPADVITIPLVDIVQGENTLEFKVTNKAGNTGVDQNPGGLIYKLNINGNCGAEYFQNHCSLWQETDLTNQKFFNFDDVKPGDFGTDVISLHVYDNAAYACMLPINKKDLENNCNSAETKALDTTCTTADGDGELGAQINVVAWDDVDKNGVHSPTEVIFDQGSIKDLLAGRLTIPQSQTGYFGLAWCAGTIVVDGTTGAVTCNANGMTNVAQTDSFQADLELYAVQSRNNEGFSCENIPLLK
jgi:predicted ribosomally synthesized peptide with SipW-like signal peptide